MLVIIMIVMLALLLLAALPIWRYSNSWGYYPSIGLGLALLTVISLAMKGHL